MCEMPPVGYSNRQMALSWSPQLLHRYLSAVVEGCAGTPRLPEYHMGRIGVLREHPLKEITKSTLHRGISHNPGPAEGGLSHPEAPCFVPQPQKREGCAATGS